MRSSGGSGRRSCCTGTTRSCTGGCRSRGLLFGIPVPPPGEVDQFIEEGFEVALGERKLLTTIHTPGHSPGIVLFLYGGSMGTS